MSFYQMLFGTAADADAVLEKLGLKKDDFYRYRDTYRDGDVVCVYTRGGGGNRKCWKDDDECPSGAHGPTCVVPMQARLREHPLYIDDFDDDFDETYATFRFRTSIDITTVPERQESFWPDALDAFKKALEV